MMDRNEYENAEQVRLILKYWFYSRISGCVGLLFLFVTLITPNWIRINSTLSKINLGLWNICLDNTCREVSGHAPILDTCRILLSISTLSGLVAVSAGLISNPRAGQSKWPLITSLATALTSLLAIVLFSVSVMSQLTFFREEREAEEIQFHYVLSYSFIGCCVGCILFFISWVLFVLVKIKESAIMPPPCPVGPENTTETDSIGVDADRSIEQSLSGIGCAYGVM
ncbi:uncharacterized protein LOC143838994 [Paroedura picta]|uniref:uncharacterized protein LOC143838994 n=1 Tax=Paroedura picta TaxID=143630 RepID=UPI004057C680